MFNTFATLGGDPEGFLYKKGVPVPAHEAGFPTQKESKERVFRDGWAVEFNPAPSTCRALLTSNFRDLRGYSSHLYAIARSNYHLLMVPTIEMPAGWMRDAPADVLQVGCRPAFNAYTGREERPEVSYLAGYPYRHAGGHMHISVSAYAKTLTPIIARTYRDYSVSATSIQTNQWFQWYNDHREVCHQVMLWDRYVGLLFTYLFGSEGLALRRKMYGQAGEFRYQRHSQHSYGLEYRVPGPEIWLSSGITGLFYEIFRLVYENRPVILEMHAGEPGRIQREVRDAINAGITHNDLLDLVPTLRGIYSKSQLPKVRRYCEKLSRDLFVALDRQWPVETHTGWTTLYHELTGATIASDEECRPIREDADDEWDGGLAPIDTRFRFFPDAQMSARHYPI